MSESNAPTIASTDAFVAKAHEGQLYGTEPYVNHLRRVAQRLRRHGEYAVMAGLLHDWVEDCDGDLNTLYDMGYPDVVVEAVDAVTLRENEAYDALIMRAAAHPLGCLVKIADNMDDTDRLLELRFTDPDRADRLEQKSERAREVLIPAGLARRAEVRQAGGNVLFGPRVD